MDNSSKISITHYRAPAIEGTQIHFDCPPGQVLTGPNTSTCMGNREWEPFPREVECKGNNTEHNIMHTPKLAKRGIKYHKNLID
jgi:hypothetical protein